MKKTLLTLAVLGCSVLAVQAQPGGMGGFSSAPNTKMPEALIPDVEKTKAENTLLWMVCGNEDNLMYNSARLKAFCDEHGVPCTLVEYPGGKHDFVVWKYGLYNFAQLIFRP